MPGPGVLLILLVVTVAAAVIGVVQYTRASAAQAVVAARSTVGTERPASLRLRADEWLRRTEVGRGMVLRLSASGTDLRVVDFVLIVVAAAAVAFQLSSVLLPVWAALLVGLAAVRACYATLRRLREKRHDAFVNQMPEVARVLSNASSAGLSMATGIAMAAKELEEPAATELLKVREELRLGASIDQALHNLERRMPSREVGVLVTTLVIQQRAGGDIVSALRDLAATLEGRRELHREIRTMMAGEVAGAYFVLAIGIGALLFLNQIEQGLVERMLSSVLGVGALLVAGTLMSVGLLMVRRITKVET